MIRNERVVGSNPISGSSNHAVPEKSGAVFCFGATISATIELAYWHNGRLFKICRACHYLIQ